MYIQISSRSYENLKYENRANALFSVVLQTLSKAVSCWKVHLIISARALADVYLWGHTMGTEYVQQGLMIGNRLCFASVT